MNENFECAQDIREKELIKLGYISQKCYFRIGRAIYIIEPATRELTAEEAKKEALNTPLGVAVALSGNAEKVDEETAKMMQALFMPTGFLQVKVEGDPDAGIDKCSDEIKLSAYRFGLDDVYINGRLFDSTHGSRKEILLTYADEIEGMAGVLQAGKNEYEKEKRQCERLAKAVRKLAE